MASNYKDKLAPEEIQSPQKGFVDRLFGASLQNYAERKTAAAIKKYATLPDGRLDQDLAAYINKKLAQSTAINSRYVMGPGSWVITLAATARALGEGYNNYKKHGQANGTQDKFTFAATNSVILLGAMAIDAFRMRLHFNGAFQGELEGALTSKRQERYVERLADQRAQEMAQPPTMSGRY